MCGLSMAMGDRPCEKPWIHALHVKCVDISSKSTEMVSRLHFKQLPKGIRTLGHLKYLAAALAGWRGAAGSGEGLRLEK